MEEQWGIEDTDHAYFTEAVRITSPNGFVFLLSGPVEAVELLAVLSLRGALISVTDGSRLQLDMQGNIGVIDTDKWVNPDFPFGTAVTNAPALAYALKRYLVEKLA